MRSFFASVSQQTSASSTPSSFQDGEVQISKDLIDMAKNDCSAVVTSLAIYKSPMEQTTPTVYHRFLVAEMVDLQCAGSPAQKGPYHIRAERSAGNAEEGDLKAKIKIQVTFCESNLPVVKFQALELAPRIPIATILGILRKPSPDYNVLSSNCSSYAHDTFNALFNALEPEEKHELHGIPKKLPDTVKPDEATSHTVVNAIIAIAVPVLTHAVDIILDCPDYSSSSSYD